MCESVSVVIIIDFFPIPTIISCTYVHEVE